MMKRHRELELIREPPKPKPKLSQREEARSASEDEWAYRAHFWIWWGMRANAFRHGRRR